VPARAGKRCRAARRIAARSSVKRIVAPEEHGWKENSIMTKRKSLGKSKSPGRKSAAKDQPIVQDRAAHFSSDWTLVIDGEPVASDDPAELAARRRAMIDSRKKTPT
jgi:hypothetical protein